MSADHAALRRQGFQENYVNGNFGTVGLIVAGLLPIPLAIFSANFMALPLRVKGSDAGHARIIARYILPNVMTTIIILATIGLGGVILAESALSFLGFGVPPPHPSWGSMLSGSGRTYMYRAPWMAIWPGVAISLAVFGFNMLGDALRDVLDPRSRQVGPLTTVTAPPAAPGRS